MKSLAKRTPRRSIVLKSLLCLCGAGLTNASSAYAANEDGISAYFDTNTQTQYVFFLDYTGTLDVLSCVHPGGCWQLNNIAPNYMTNVGLSLPSTFDGSTGHLYYPGRQYDNAPYLSELSGNPPSSGAYSSLTNYAIILRPQSTYYNGDLHVFYEDSNHQLREMYHDSQWWDHAIPQCPYGSIHDDVAAYWDGTNQRVMFDCTNSSTGATELWQTYYSPNVWRTLKIASTASGGAPLGNLAAGSFKGNQFVLGVGNGNSLVLVQNRGSGWYPTTISVPSVNIDSQFLTYADSVAQRFFFVGADFHLYELEVVVGGSNTVYDLSVAQGWPYYTDVPGGYSDIYGDYYMSQLAGYFDGSTDHVFFTGGSGDIWEFYGSPNAQPSGWYSHALTSGYPAFTH